MSQNRTSQTFSRFRRNIAGNVAVLFALSALPMLLLSGAGVDYASALNERARLQSAADATALALVLQPRGTPIGQLQTFAEKQFAAGLGSRLNESSSVAVTVVGQTIRVAVNASMPTAFMKLVQQNTISIGVSSTAAYARKKIQVALALDNTGSMGQMGKMAALKTAANDLLTKLQTLNADPGDVKVSIVPFNTQVRVNSTYANAGWLRWGVRLENTNIPAATATSPTPATWGGCISDRDQDYDISSAPPIGGSSNYVAANCEYGPLAQTAPLTSNLTAVRTTVNSMTPTGATNVTIGFATALATLRADSPLGDASSNDPEVQKFLILLTDGNNTQNRFGGDGREGNLYTVDIDERLRQACAMARATNVQVFTIRVIAGNEPLLRGCATNPSMYFSATTAADIAPAFAEILNRISRPRLTM